MAREPTSPTLFPLFVFVSVAWQLADLCLPIIPSQAWCEAVSLTGTTEDFLGKKSELDTLIKRLGVG